MLKLCTRVLLMGLSLTLVWGQAQAEETAKALDFTIHQEYTGTRALGMGNAFTAIADDHSGLFYNPAALARRKDGQLRMFLRAGVDAEYFQLLDDIEDSENEELEDDQIDSINELIRDNYGKHYYSRIPTVGGVWVRPNWGIAVIPADLSIDIAIHNNLGPSLHLNAFADTTIAYGYARDFKWFGEHHFSMGVTAKALHRIHTSKQVLASSLVTDEDLLNNSDANEGMTFDLDIGTMLTPKWWKSVEPTFAVVVRNAIDMGYPIQFNVVNEDADEPEKLHRRIDLGSAWQFSKWWVFEPKLAFDVRDILHPNWSLVKGLHAGAELFWRMFNWWKGYWSVGVNQGYYTAGFGARLAWFQLDIATFGEEVGTKSEKIESRRYMVEMSLDF